jgi:hypothetical protein
LASLAEQTIRGVRARAGAELPLVSLGPECIQWRWEEQAQDDRLPLGLPQPVGA